MAVSTLRQMALPFTSFAKWYTNCAKAHPLTTAILTSGIKTSAADLFAQKVNTPIHLLQYVLACMARLHEAHGSMLAWLTTQARVDPCHR